MAITMLLALPLSAQPASREAQAAPSAPQAPPAPAAQPAAPAPPPAPRPMPTRNVKVTVNISDQQGDQPAVAKTVTLVVADGHKGVVRSRTVVPLLRRMGTIAQETEHTLPLNVDAEVGLTPDEMVLLNLSFNYGVLSQRPQDAVPAGDTASNDERTRVFGEISEHLVLLVRPGTSIVASQSADAASDRRVTVEVLAEIVK